MLCSLQMQTQTVSLLIPCADFKVCYISFYLAASIFHSNSSFRFPPVVVGVKLPKWATCTWAKNLILRDLFRFPGTKTKIKTNKINFCRTLSSSDDVQDRETEKGRLEEAFETCDRDLDKLIVQHYAELTTAIRTYQSITERITSSRNKIKQVKKKRGD